MLGYVLGSGHWGGGLMSEAVRGMVAYGFDKMGLHRVEGQCRVENTASANVMLKAGLKEEGLLRERFYLDGTFHDARLFAAVARPAD